MLVSISGRHVAIDDALRSYAEDKMTALVEKHFPNATSSNVSFRQEGREIACEILVHDGTGKNVVIKSNNIAQDKHHAFDKTFDKIGAQLKKYKSKLNSHHKTVKISEVSGSEDKGIKYVISKQLDSEEGLEESVIDNPVIIAEKPTQVLSLSVGEAVMRMDLQNLPALMFKNKKSGKANVVYYRKDGNISWVDSE